MATVRLLLIEDDEYIAEPLAETLQEFYVVDYVASGTKALQLCKINEYDLIILDLGLPDGSGIQVCKKMRTNGLIAPILILTAEISTDSKIEALDAGADDYVTKPFHPKELTARLRALLRRPEQVMSTVLHIDNLYLDPINRTVVRDGKPVYLRRKQFDILELLMRHQGQVLSREKILTHAWETSNDSFSNIVDVHIKYLRDQVDKPFAHHLIHTVSGLGYKIED